jgi:thioredoxin reductase (NADPH)
MDKTIRNLDLLIIGGGPAGLSAAIYASRAKLDTVLLETRLAGGQLRDSYRIENYPGFPSVTGAELSKLFAEQAQKTGADIQNFSRVLDIRLTEEEKTVETKKIIYKPKAVILATGAMPKKLPVPSEERYAGKGVHYCATCDGANYEGSVVGVVGGGNSALEEALLLARYASKVIMIRRRGYFNGEKAMLDEITSNPAIEVLFHWDLVDVEGEDFVSRAVIRNTQTGEEKKIELSAVFGSIGMDPQTGLFKDCFQLLPGGYIPTDERMQTPVKGVYAAGDVRYKEYRQITTAVADGTIAALSAEKYIRLTK